MGLFAATVSVIAAIALVGAGLAILITGMFFATRAELREISRRLDHQDTE